MKYRVLAALPVVITAALYLVVHLVGDRAMGAEVLTRSVQSAKIAAGVGCIVAAFTFARGDYLRRAWLFAGVSSVLLARDIWLFPLGMETTFLGVTVEAINHVIVGIANVFGVAATVLMARAWQVGGIELPGSSMRKWMVVVAAIVVAFAIAGVPLVHDLANVAAGKKVPLINMISSGADIVSIALIAPVLLTVLAIRGGVLVWPWSLYMASMVAWLAYDAADVLSRSASFASHAASLGIVAELMRVLACGYLCVSGVAQRTSVLSVDLE
ncbi:MAG: hypothetical protein HOW73_08850 [Polyangiaceae bacterium]|nr:hypothetical protein [Polyangiaceae bacterium]